MSNSLKPYGLQASRLLCPWNSPGKNSGVGSHFLLLEIFQTQGLNPNLLHWQADSLPLSYLGSPQVCIRKKVKVESLSRVRFFATPWTVAFQAPPSVGFSRQEYWSRLPFPSPGDLPNPGIQPRSPKMQALKTAITVLCFGFHFAEVYFISLSGPT